MVVEEQKDEITMSDEYFKKISNAPSTVDNLNSEVQTNVEMVKLESVDDSDTIENEFCRYSTYIYKVDVKEEQNTSLVENDHEHLDKETLSKLYFSKSELPKHMKNHSSVKPFICYICNKSYSRKYIKDHIKTHTGEKPYSCAICEARFLHKSALNEHYRTHTGERPHICNVCESTFTNISGLTKHKKLHTGEKPYVCHTCNKTFARAAKRILRQLIFLKFIAKF